MVCQQDGVGCGGLQFFFEGGTKDFFGIRKSRIRFHHGIFQSDKGDFFAVFYKIYRIIGQNGNAKGFEFFAKSFVFRKPRLVVAGHIVGRGDVHRFSIKERAVSGSG